MACQQDHRHHRRPSCRPRTSQNHHLTQLTKKPFTPSQCTSCHPLLQKISLHSALKEHDRCGRAPWCCSLQERGGGTEEGRDQWWLSLSAAAHSRQSSGDTTGGSMPLQPVSSSQAALPSPESSPRFLPLPVTLLRLSTCVFTCVSDFWWKIPQRLSLDSTTTSFLPFDPARIHLWSTEPSSPQFLGGFLPLPTSFPGLLLVSGSPPRFYPILILLMLLYPLQTLVVLCNAHSVHTASIRSSYMNRLNNDSTGMVVPSCTTSQSFIPQSRKQPLVVQGRVRQSQSISLSILEFVFFGENVRTYWDATVWLGGLIRSD